MDNGYQQFSNTSSDIQNNGSDSETLFPLDRLENSGDYWNDLVTEALGPDQHDMDSNIEIDTATEHYHVTL